MILRLTVISRTCTPNSERQPDVEGRDGRVDENHDVVAS